MYVRTWLQSLPPWKQKLLLHFIWWGSNTRASIFQRKGGQRPWPHTAQESRQETRRWVMHDQQEPPEDPSVLSNGGSSTPEPWLRSVPLCKQQCLLFRFSFFWFLYLSLPVLELQCTTTPEGSIFLTFPRQKCPCHSYMDFIFETKSLCKARADFKLTILVLIPPQN